MTNKKLISLFVGFVLLYSTSSLFASGSKDIPPSVSVTGKGVVEVKPDRAALSLSVITRNKEAAKAAQENAKLMTNVLEAVKKAGIDEKDAATKNYSMYLENNYNRDSKIETKNYRVTNNVEIIVKDIDSVGTILDVALTAGANQLSSIRFFASNTKDAYNEARRLAMLQAKDVAKILVTTSGQKLGKPLSISEGYNNATYRAEEYDAPALSKNAYAVSGTPVNAANTDISVSVDVTFEIK